MNPEMVKQNEKIKVSMFLSFLGILSFMLFGFMAYFYNTDAQRLLRDDSTSLAYVSMAAVVAFISVVVGIKSILNTYRMLRDL